MRPVFPVLLLALVGAPIVPLAAQTATADAPPAWRPQLLVFAHGGGVASLRALDETGGGNKPGTGLALGGGLGVQIHPLLAIRGDFTWTEAAFPDDAASTLLRGQDLQRLYYGGDLQLRLPFPSGVTPSLFVGAGAVTLERDNGERLTRFAPKGGLGLEYLSHRTGLGVLAQGTVWSYAYDADGFDRRQYDLLVTLGLTFRPKL